MKPILLLFTVFCFQMDFNKPYYLEKVDFSNDGKVMVGIGQEYIILLNAEKLKVLDKMKLPGYSTKNPNIRISGDGKHIIWANGWKMYYARIHKNKIRKPIELINRVWLDMEINFDGTEFIAALDRRSSPRKCSPGKRQTVKFWRDGDTFEWDTLLPKMDDCVFVSNAELTPNGEVIYEWNNSNTEHPHPTIFEAIPDGRSDWGHLSIYDKGDRLGHQSMTADGRFLTYRMEGESGFYNGFCGLYLTKRNENGYWEKSQNILPRDKDCQGPWFSVISPDGEKIAWLKYTRDERGTPIKADIMISRFENEKWTTPKVLVSDYGLSTQKRQIKSMRISNTNLAFVLWTGRTYLCTTLDENKTLFEIE